VEDNGAPPRKLDVLVLFRLQLVHTLSLPARSIAWFSRRFNPMVDPCLSFGHSLQGTDLDNKAAMSPLVVVLWICMPLTSPMALGTMNQPLIYCESDIRHSNIGMIKRTLGLPPAVAHKSLKAVDPSHLTNHATQVLTLFYIIAPSPHLGRILIRKSMT